MGRFQKYWTMESLNFGGVVTDSLGSAPAPVVGIIMGSDSDLPTMAGAIAVCEEFDIPHEVAIVSAHRTPDRMVTYGQQAHQRGPKVIIAGAGGAAAGEAAEGEEGLATP